MKTKDCTGTHEDLPLPLVIINLIGILAKRAAWTWCRILAEPCGNLMVEVANRFILSSFNFYSWVFAPQLTFSAFRNVFKEKKNNKKVSASASLLYRCLFSLSLRATFSRLGYSHQVDFVHFFSTAQGKPLATLHRKSTIRTNFLPNYLMWGSAGTSGANSANSAEGRAVFTSNTEMFCHFRHKYLLNIDFCWVSYSNQTGNTLSLIYCFSEIPTGCQVVQKSAKKTRKKTHICS